MKRNSFLVVLLLFALAFLFVGCKKEEEPEPNPILVVGNIELQTEEGKTVKINAAIANVEDEEEEYELEFSSSDPTIAEVDANGNVDAKKAGEATITVSIKDFEDQKTEVKVIVLAKPTPPGKEIIEEFIPESIDIMGFVSMEVGASEKFMAMVKPASAYQVLVWSTSDPSIATVDNEGNVTAHSFGTVTITAHSAIDPDVKDSFEVVVKETGEDHEIAAKAFDYILERIPKYVTESFDLPVYPNPDVTITWKDASGTVLDDNRYVYNEDITEDTTDAVICLIEYGLATREESVALKVVADPEKNNFANIELISLYLDILFADYIADSVNGDLPLPTALKGATLVWSTTKSDVITKTGEFTKPNNDTPVRLTALVTSGPIAQTFNFDLVAKGYTQQEKVDYSLTEGVLKPLVGLRSNANITLPSFEPRFGLTITWESANEDVFDSNGVYMERNLEKDTEVTFIATFKEGDTVFDVTAEVTVTALAATDVSKAVYDFVNNNEILEAIPTYFPFGLPGRESGNEIVGLPTTMEGLDGVTIEWEGNPEDFDGLVLKTQYLRYHETYLTATFSKEGVEPSTLKFLLNTGIAERDDSVNIGGRFSEQKVKDGFIEWDLLSTFSFWDKPVGEQDYKTQRYWSFWSGYTWYIDAETDRTSTLEQVEPGEGKRYQYFAMDFVTVYIMDVDADGKVTDWEYGNLREKTGGNWGVFFVNLSGKAAKIPLATHGAGEGTDGEPWVSQGERENALTFDGYRKGFVTDETGKVIIGSGFGTLQDVLPSTARHIDIPAYGYGMTFKTQENLPIVGVFCHPDTTLTFEKYYLAPENDFRAVRYKSNLENAENALELREQGKTTTVNIDQAIINAYTYLKDRMLSEFEYAMFDQARLAAVVARSAAVWELDIQEMRGLVEEEDYLIQLFEFYNKY
ncbi:MAG: Ig-like domain-containing protein, partial [Bacillota bacterium]|nr:Ig-like domain-containing protein [Bacillota bacterium]